VNKRHWNSILLDGGVPADECCGLIDHSYDLVAQKKRPAR
jgi:predicted DNA-binding protein (MmcQ/YjbR family)